MKISEAKSNFESNYFSHAEIRKNPSEVNEHIILLHTTDGKSFMLCYENGAILHSKELDHLILMLKQVGFKKAKIYF